MKAKKWSQETWKAITPIFKKILKHPFLTKLMDGTLAKDKFLFYLHQDAMYLEDFSKVLAGIAVKCQGREVVGSFLGFAGDSVEVERELHRSFLGKAGPVGEPSPTCLLYTSFMHRQLAITSTEVAIASVLPCFWVYKEVGDYILAAKSKVKAKRVNPYKDWIDTYGGEEYGNAVLKAIDLADKAAAKATPATRAAMTQAFTLCTKMEWMFWDSAWRKESWPV